MVAAYLVFLALVVAERIFELHVSRRNAEWSRARGGIEVGGGHFIWMKLLHTSFFAACALEVVGLERPFVPWLGVSMLGVFAVAQVIRFSAITALGPRWNVRVIVIPGMAPVRSGPYRFLRHPNYLAVVLEIAAIPLVHTAFLTAIVFSALNLLLLRTRIRCEEAALGEHCPAL